MFTIVLFSKFKPIRKLVLVFFISLLWCVSAQAVVGINQKVFERLQQAQQLAEEKQYQPASELLQGLFKRKLNDHELAQVKNLQANVHLLQRQYEPAIKLYSEIVEINDIPDGLRDSSYRVLMQLHMTQENYPKALSYADKLLLSLSEIDSNLLALRGQCYFQMAEYSKALESIQRAINTEAKLGNPPKENWLLMLNAIHHTREDYSAMLSVLEQLITHYPDDRYIYNLAAVHGQLEQPRKQLLLLEPLYEQGYLTKKSEILLLAQLYLSEGLPVKAATLIERHVSWQGHENTAANTFTAKQRDLEVLAQAWTLAREPDRAIAPLSVAAADAKDGENYLRLAYAHHSLGDWAGVADAVKRALQKGRLRNRGHALVLLGMAQYRMKQYDASLKTFARASRTPAVADMGAQWLRFVEGQQEKQRLAQRAQ